MNTIKYEGLGYYVIIDIHNKIIFETMNKIEAEEKFLQLRDNSPNVRIVLAEIKKEFERKNGEESMNEFL